MGQKERRGGEELRKKFSSIQKAQRFAKTTNMKVKRGPKTTMSNGKKGNWYTLTKKGRKR